MIPNCAQFELLGIAPKARDKEDMMNFLKWLQSLGEGISLLPTSSVSKRDVRPQTAEETFEYGYHAYDLSEEERRTDFTSWIVFDIQPQWLTLPESDINVQFQNWNDEQYAIIAWMDTLLQFRQPKKSAELANNVPDLLRIVKAAHLKYKPFLTVLGPRNKYGSTPYNLEKPRIYADWVTIIGSELLRKRKITLPKVPDSLLVEDLDGDVMISSKLSYAEFVKQGFSEEEKAFWKSIGATIRYNPKAKKPKDDSETYIVKDSPEGLYLEPLDKKKFFGEKRD